MDFLILAIALGAVAVILAIMICVIMMKVFETEKIDIFAFALLMLIISEVMIIFLTVICVFKLTGIA